MSETIFCTACGHPGININATACPSCGKPFKAVPAVTEKSKFAFLVMLWFLGGFGAHYFYLGKPKIAKKFLLSWLILAPFVWLPYNFCCVMFMTDAQFAEYVNNLE